MSEDAVTDPKALRKHIKKALSFSPHSIEYKVGSWIALREAKRVLKRLMRENAALRAQLEAKGGE